LPLSKRVKAESGTIVSLAVLTAEPVEMVLRPVVANALFAALRAASPAVRPAPAGAAPRFAMGALATTSPGKGRLFCVPLTLPPPVLM
jgi:hypothetical protein